LRRAIDVVLRRDSAPEGRVDRLAVHVAVLELFRDACSRSPMLVVLDDMQWLDAETGAALSFALRRLEAGMVVLAAARFNDAGIDVGLDIQQALPHPVRRLHLRVLDDDAITSLVHQAAGQHQLTAEVVRTVVGLSAGNPLVALELTDALVGRGSPPKIDELPIPERLNVLLGDRLNVLSMQERHVLRAAALAARPTPALLVKLFGPQALEAVAAAEAAGVASWQGGRLVFGHPLLSACVVAGMSAELRRHLHADLAAVVEEVTERALHLGAATAAPQPRGGGHVDVCCRGSTKARCTGRGRQTCRTRHRPGAGG
jgi:hypothetical protein